MSPSKPKSGAATDAARPSSSSDHRSAPGTDDGRVQAASLFVISAPSGAGKTSLVRELLQRRSDVRMSTSYTTRPRRPTEVHGEHYYFVDETAFVRMIGDNDFLEHANVFGNRYGTSRSQVQGLLSEGQNVILEIDWQGAGQVRTAMAHCKSVFVLPPSVVELERRLRGRATDSDEVIARRLSDARSDMSHWDEFDYVIVNDDFETAVGDLTSIITRGGPGLGAERASLRPLVSELLASPST